jgi:hypothetical protein
VPAEIPTADATIRWLFAETWAEPTETQFPEAVPGAVVNGLTTAAALLEIGLWSLRERGLIALEPLRPVEPEPVLKLGGRSFVRVTPRPPQPGDRGTEIGLQAHLLNAVRSVAREDEGIGERAVRRLSGDDRQGLRPTLLSLGMPNRSPWRWVLDVCFVDAREHGLIDLRGRLFRKRFVPDLTAIAAVRPRNAEIAAAHEAYRAREPDLAGAVLADCVTALDWKRTGAP